MTNTLKMKPGDIITLKAFADAIEADPNMKIVRANAK